MKKGLQVDQDCLFSMRGGIASVLVVEIKCNVLLVKEGEKKPFFIGLNYCITGAYSNASSTDSSSYYPLTGDTRSEMLSVSAQHLLTS